MKVFCQENQILILEKRKDKDGEPVQNALVCVMMDSTIYQYGNTDSLGQITFTIVPQHTGVLHITVTGHNYFPYESTVNVLPVGINETFNSLRSMLQIYPNPARSVLALRIPQSADRQAISIFDVSGEVIKEAVSLRDDREIKIALKGINPGVYFLRVGRKITKFIVVR